MSDVALLRIAGLPFEALAGLRAADCLATIADLLEDERVLAAEAPRISDALFRAAGAAAEDPARAAARFALLRIRRDVHNGRRIRTEDLDRAAAVLAPELTGLLEGYARRWERRAAALSAYDRGFRDALARGRAELLRIAADPLVDHGIYLASRALVPKLRRLATADVRDLAHDERHTLAKAAAYVARFAAKTSPNGVFCSVGLVPLEGESTSIRGDAGIARVDVLLNLSEVRKVTACLAVDAQAAPAILPRPNPTLLLRDGAWTYWKPATPRNLDDLEVHLKARDHPVLRAFVEAAGPGTLHAAALVEDVASRTGRPVAELEPFYAMLVERGILIAEIEIPYSSRRRLRDLADAARRAGSHAGWIESIERIEEEVDALPALDPAARTEAMERIVPRFEALARKRPFRPDELFRVDSATSLEMRLPARLLDELSAPIRMFARLLAAIYPDELNQRVLHRRFLKMYPPDTDVELLELYGSLAETGGEEEDPRPLEFPAPSGTAKAGTPEGTALEAQRRLFAWAVERAEEASPGQEVEIDAGTLRSLVGDVPEPRWAAGALFQIAAATAEDVDRGRYRLVLNALFNGIGLALARFSHLLGRGDAGPDNPVVAQLRRAWTAMERPGALLAELTFNHEARTANAGLRPVLFGHEIELPGDRSSPGVETIPLADLVVRYESESGRLVLRWRSRGVEVIPVVSSGVSPSGIVSELLHIGRQGWQTIGYLPGFEARHVVRWPRFTCGKLVLFRARWVLRGVAALPEDRFFLEVARWRLRHGMPRHVFVHTQAEPKPFYVDLDAPLLVDLMRRALVASGAASSDPVLFVTEMLPAPEEMFVRDARGTYATELLVQMLGGPARSS